MHVAIIPHITKIRQVKMTVMFVGDILCFSTAGYQSGVGMFILILFVNETS